MEGCMNKFNEIDLTKSPLDLNFVAIDFETTIDPKDNNPTIIEIGAVQLNGRIIRDDYFKTLVNPECTVRAIDRDITGIKVRDLIESKPIKFFYSELLIFMMNRIIIAHNAAIDLRVLTITGNRLNNEFQYALAIDTLKMAKDLLDLPNYRLATLMNHFKIKSLSHRAFEDAKATAIIFVKLIGLLIDKNKNIALKDLSKYFIKEEPKQLKLF